MPRNGKLPVLNLLTNQKSGFSIRPAEATRCTDSRKTWHGRLSSGSAWLYKISPHLVRGVGMRPKNIKISTFWSTVASQGRTLWPISKNFRGFYTLNYPALAFQISLDSYHRLRSYCWETASRLIRPNFSVHPLGKTMRWIEKWMHLFDGLDELYRRTKFGGDRTTRAGCRCENVVFVTMFFSVCHASRVWRTVGFRGVNSSNKHCVAVYRPISMRFSAFFFTRDCSFRHAT